MYTESKGRIALAQVNQLLAELDKECRSRFGDVAFPRAEQKLISLYIRYCRGEVTERALPRERRADLRSLKKMWQEVYNGNIMTLPVLPRLLLMVRGIREKYPDDPQSVDIETQALSIYIVDLLKKHARLAKEGYAEAAAMDTQKVQRARLKARAFEMMEEELENMAVRNESEAARRVWNRSMRDVFKNARSLCSQYNTWKNANARASRAQGARANK